MSSNSDDKLRGALINSIKDQLDTRRAEQDAKQDWFRDVVVKAVRDNLKPQDGKDQK